MNNTLIRLNTVDEVKEFVSAAEKCAFDIDVKYNRIIVDAKSMLGVLSICSNAFLVCSHDENEEFEGVLEKFRVS